MKITFDPENASDMIAVTKILNVVNGDGLATTATGPTEPDISASTDMADVDINGTPWIAEVHATTKNKNTDGRWKKKRNVDDAVLEAAEAAARAEIATLHSAVQAQPDPEPVASEPIMPPVSIEMLNGRYAEVAADIDTTLVEGWYARHQIVPSEFATNETMRARCYNLLGDPHTLAELMPKAAPVVQMPGMPGA